jgi:Zn-finger nucleic acid-binding protein
LSVYKCKKCQGFWISALKYREWLDKYEPDFYEQVDYDAPLPVLDVEQAKLCPDCGRILICYRVWPDISFRLDRCWGCNGVWFDHAEWDVLRSHGLYDKVHMFFTEPWQRKLREEETRRRFEAIYLEYFGPQDYAEIKRIREWIQQHPEGQRLLAYLNDKDPYKVRLKRER